MKRDVILTLERAYFIEFRALYIIISLPIIESIDGTTVAGEFPNLPENEDLTMHLAEHFGINTAAHSLIRLKSGELAYLTKRFDRAKQGKLAVEDMCQLTETLTADKYHSSMEKGPALMRSTFLKPR